MTIKIGNAPCSWGVEFADDPRNPSWQEVLRQNAEAGYKGIELGPVGFMPEDPSVLADALAEHDLELIGGVVDEEVAVPARVQVVGVDVTIADRKIDLRAVDPDANEILELTIGEFGVFLGGKDELHRHHIACGDEIDIQIGRVKRIGPGGGVKGWVVIWPA